MADTGVKKTSAELPEKVEFKPGKQGGKVELRGGFQLEVPPDLLDKRDIITCLTVPHIYRTNYRPQIENCKLASEMYLIQSKYNLKTFMVVAIYCNELWHSMAEIHLYHRTAASDHWNLIESKQDGRHIVANIKDNGLYTLLWLPVEERFTITPDGGLFNFKIDPMLSLRISKRCTKKTVDVSFKIFPVFDERLNEFSQIYSSEFGDFENLSPFYHFDLSNKLDLRRPVALKLPLPNWLMRSYEEQGQSIVNDEWVHENVVVLFSPSSPTNVTALQFQQEGDEQAISTTNKPMERVWTVLESQLKFTNSSISFDTKDLGRFIVVQPNASRLMRLTTSLPRIDYCNMHSLCRLFVFVHREEVGWNVNIQFTRFSEVEDAVQRLLESGYVRVKRLRSQNNNDMLNNASRRRRRSKPIINVEEDENDDENDNSGWNRPRRRMTSEQAQQIHVELSDGSGYLISLQSDDIQLAGPGDHERTFKNLVGLRSVNKPHSRSRDVKPVRKNNLGPTKKATVPTPTESSVTNTMEQQEILDEASESSELPRTQISLSSIGKTTAQMQVNEEPPPPPWIPQPDEMEMHYEEMLSCNDVSISIAPVESMIDRLMEMAVQGRLASIKETDNDNNNHGRDAMQSRSLSEFDNSTEQGDFTALLQCRWIPAIHKNISINQEDLTSQMEERGSMCYRLKFTIQEMMSCLNVTEASLLQRAENIARQREEEERAAQQSKEMWYEEEDESSLHPHSPSKQPRKKKVSSILMEIEEEKRQRKIQDEKVARQQVFTRLITDTRPQKQVAREPKVINGKSLQILSRHVEFGLTLAVHLNLPENVLTGFGMDSLSMGYGLQDVTYKILLYWKRNYPSKQKSHMMDDLIHALTSMGQHRVVRVIENCHASNKELSEAAFAALEE